MLIIIIDCFGNSSYFFIEEMNIDYIDKKFIFNTIRDKMQNIYLLEEVLVIKQDKILRKFKHEQTEEYHTYDLLEVKSG